MRSDRTNVGRALKIGLGVAGAVFILAQVVAAAPPVANDDNFSGARGTNEDGERSFDFGLDFKTNDTGVGIVLHDVDVSSAAGAAIGRVGDSVTYDPRGANALQMLPVGGSTVDSFDYTIRDSSNQQATATVQIEVEGVNDPPSVLDDDHGNAGSLSTDEDTALSIHRNVVLANDSDVDIGDTLSIANVIDGSISGRVSLAGAHITYDPDSQFEALGVGDNTTDSFLYVVSDTVGATVTGLVTVTVTGVNDPPVANDDDDGNTGGNLSTDEDTAISIDHAVLLANDYDVDSGVLFSLVSVDSALTTGAVFSAAGEIQYNPAGEFDWLGEGVTVTDRFDYVIEDDQGAAGRGTVSITIIGVNDAPTLTQTVAQVALPVFDNDDTARPFQQFTFTDPDSVPGETFDVTVRPNAYGSFTPDMQFTVTAYDLTNTLKSLTFAPTENFIDSYWHPGQRVRFGVEIIDAGSATGTASLAVDIIATNDRPYIAGVPVHIIRVDDDDSVKPFETVLLKDVDEQGRQVVELTVSFSHDVGEVVPGSFPEGGAGEVSVKTNAGVVTTSYTIRDRERGEAEQYLQRLEFTPTPNVMPVGDTRLVQFTITLDDGIGRPRVNDSTEVSITSVNSVPRITANEDVTALPYVIPPEDPVRPFLKMGVGVSDDDTNLSVTVSLDEHLKGNLVLTNAALVLESHFAEDPTDPGVYVFTGSVDVIAAVFSNLEYRVNDAYPHRPDLPGFTIFTVRATDPIFRTGYRDFSVVVQGETRNWLVTRTTDDLDPGSLRYALSQIETNMENGAVVTFALPAYEDEILLDEALGPLVLTRNVAIKGPGADLLSISGDSDGDGTPDMQIFRVFSWVSIEGLTLRLGIADTGGAVYVGVREIAPGTVQTGQLLLRSCAVTDCQAEYWGGGIDVDQGRLVMEGCLVRGNSVSAARGSGGGGVSVYTDLSCSFQNTTFAENAQLALGGYGGGALYVENNNPVSSLTIDVIHCTFAGNLDVGDNGSSIAVNVFGADVRLRNSIFSDELGRNLWVLGAGSMTSFGGCLSDDSTHVILTQNGQPNDTILLDGPNDMPLTDPELLPLGRVLGTTDGYLPDGGSPAIGNALVTGWATDQHGVMRDAQPDSGALEFDADRRLVLNEIHFDPRSGESQFLEFYVPRAGNTAVDLTAHTVWIDGVRTHVFSGGTNVVLSPGRGIVVADDVFAAGHTNYPTPVVTPGEGVISGYDRVAGKTAVKVTSSAHGLAEGATVLITNAAFAAYNDKHVVRDVMPDSFGIPVAFRGTGSISDYEGTNGSPSVAVVSRGHGLVVGARIVVSNSHVSAYNGEHTVTDVTTDTFTIPVGYVGGQVVESYGGVTGAPPVMVTVTNHGFTTNAEVVVSGAGPSAYNGTFLISPVSSNAFTIPIAYQDEMPVEAYQGNTGDTVVTIVSTNHGLRSGATIEITGGNAIWYNGIHSNVVQTGTNTFQIATPYVAIPSTNNGVWRPIDTGEISPVAAGVWYPVDTGGWKGVLNLGREGLVEVRDPADRSVVSASYLGRFADLENPDDLLDTSYNSLTLAPQFRGFAYLPHSIVSGMDFGGADLGNLLTTTNTCSPGADTKPQAFGSPNAQPVAVPDEVVVDEDERIDLHVLANDFDADGLDRLVVVDVSESNAVGGDDATASSLLGASVDMDSGMSVVPLADPLLRGSSVIYDPRFAMRLQELPQGAKTTDSFAYTILDLGYGPITGYTNSVSNETVVLSFNHRLGIGETIIVSDSGVADYNGTQTVARVVDKDAFVIAAGYNGTSTNAGSWVTRNHREPTVRATAEVQVTVLGVNDPPMPIADVITNVHEHKIVRIMAMPDLAGSGSAVFTTDGDYAMTPEILTQSLLPNDLDPDTDDGGTSLTVFGIVAGVEPIDGYGGTLDAVPVTVTSTNHGLAEGATILVSGYGGHPSYNALHEVTVVDADSFTVPVKFTGDHPVKGVWAVLEDANRLAASSEFDADVKLEIRADPRETSIVYDPNPSSYLNGLAAKEIGDDSFYYAAMDRHGGAGLARVTVSVEGRNDMPVATDDPGALALLSAFRGTQTVEDVLQDLRVCYNLPPASDASGRADVRVVYTNAAVSTNVLLPDMWITWEDISLVIEKDDVLDNDTDIDRIDVHTLSWVSAFSHHGASVTLDANTNIVYDPGPSLRLNALSRDETIFDHFEVAVSDQAAGVPGIVTQTVAVLVVGTDDEPRAYDDFESTPEDVVLLMVPPSVTGNDEEDDIDGNDPDNKLLLKTILAAPTTVQGAHITLVGLTTTYDPTGSAYLDGLAVGMTYTDHYEYVVHDGSFLFAQDDLYEVEYNTTGAVLHVLGNDVNYNGVSSGMAIGDVCAAGVAGTVTVDAVAGVLVYAPPEGFVGEEHFSYMIEDSGGYKDWARVTVRVIVDQWNGYLKASDDHFSVARGESAELNVLVNDHALPAGGAGLSVTRMVSGPDQGGSVAIVGNVLLSYEPAAMPPMPYPYHEIMRYEVSGGGVALSTAVVDVLVIDRYGKLEVADDAYAVMAGSWDNAFPVLANDYVLPAAADGWTVRSVVPTNVARISGDGTGILYTPPDRFVGGDVLTYVAYDGIGGTGTGTVTVTVADLVVCADAFAVPTNSSTVLDVLANDRWLPSGAASNVVITGVTTGGGATVGAMTVEGGSSLRFNAGGVAGRASFSYSVMSSGGSTASGEVSVAVFSGGDVAANEDFFHVTRGSVGNALDVLANDALILVSPRPLAIMAIGTGLDGPTHGGTVDINESGTGLIYSPAEEFRGEERFTYTMTDGRDTDIATVVVRVEGGRLRAENDAFTVLYEDRAPGTLTYVLTVLENDRVLPDFGQELTITGVGLDAASTNAPNQRGGVKISDDGRSLIYAPTNSAMVPEYHERFTYEISDGTYRRADATVWVTITTRTNAVELGTSDDRFAVWTDSLSNALPVLANDGHLPGTSEGWSVTGVVVPPTFGEVYVVESGVLYTPEHGFVGTDSFSYSVTDGLGGTGTADVEVYVGQLPLNRDRFVVLSGSSNNLFNVLANDWVIGRTSVPPVLHDVWGSTMGGTVVTSGQQLSYAPASGYAGSYPYVETVWYSIVDQTDNTMTGRLDVTVVARDADQDAATLTITVIGVNDAPVVTGTRDDYAITDRQMTYPFAGVTISDVDAHWFEPLEVTITLDDPGQGVLDNLGIFTASAPGVYVSPWMTGSNLTAAIQGLVFDPTENRLPVDTQERVRLTISVDDSHVVAPTVDSRTVVTVKPVNDPPTINGTIAGQEVHYNMKLRPFHSVTLGEVDEFEQQLIDVRIELDVPAHGRCENLGGFVTAASGTYVFTGTTAAAATAAMREIRFVPTPDGPVQPGYLDETRFTITVDDRFAPAVVDTRTTVATIHGYVGETRVSDSTVGDAFGFSVAAGYHLVLGGAPLEDTQGVERSGAAYLVVRDAGQSAPEWGGTHRLAYTNALVTTNQRLGFAVAMDSGTAVCGAPNYIGTATGTVPGVAFVFEGADTGTNGWQQTAVLLPADGSVPGDEFGYRVALCGDVAIIGAPRHTNQGVRTGAVYVYERDHGGTNQWGCVKKLVANDGAEDDRFGAAVAICGDCVAVGSMHHKTGGTKSGAVYVFDRNTGGTNQWGLQRKLLPEAAGTWKRFGRAVAIEGDCLVVGAPGKSSPEVLESGEVYIYGRNVGGTNAWGVVTTLTPGIAWIGSHFGLSVSMDGGLVAIGCQWDWELDPDSGACYVYARDRPGMAPWSLVERAVPPPGFAMTVEQVSIRDGVVAVGGYRKNAGDTWDSDPYPEREGTVWIHQFAMNRPPAVSVPIPSVVAEVGSPFTLVVTPETFRDPDPGDAVVLSVGVGDLPGWLSFDPVGDVFSGVPVSSGVDAVTLTATDSLGAQCFHTFAIIVVPAGAPAPGEMPASGAQWLGRHFSATELGDVGLKGTVWGQGQDPDDDGFSNYWEYLFGGDPRSAALGVSALEVTQLGSDHVAVMYTRVRGDDRLEYDLMGSPDLLLWIPADVLIEGERTLWFNEFSERVELRVRTDTILRRLYFRIDARSTQTQLW